MPIGATIATAAITTGGALYSANQQGKAIKSAQKSSDAAYQQIRSDLSPYRDAGATALNGISNPNDILKNFQASPDYNFRKSEGLNSVFTNKATNGLLRSGSAVKSAINYAGNLAGGEFGSWWNRQKGLADTGLSAAKGTIDPAQNNASNQGNAAIAGANNTGAAIGSITGSLSDIITKYGGNLFSPGGAASGSSYGGAGAADLPVYA